LIGVVQATETVKLLLGKGEPLIGRLLTYDALGMRFREVRLRRDPRCPLCGESPRIRDLSIHAETSEACAVASGDGHGAAPAAIPAAAPPPVGAPWSSVTAGC
jgi:bacteriocin biosynthesis cyclodehydratase domain-containing protein